MVNVPPPPQEDDNGGAVINAMMASVPGHPVWPLIFQVMAERAGGDVQPPRKRGVWLPPDSPLWMTGAASGRERCGGRGGHAAGMSWGPGGGGLSGCCT